VGVGRPPGSRSARRGVALEDQVEDACGEAVVEWAAGDEQPVEEGAGEDVERQVDVQVGIEVAGFDPAPHDVRDPNGEIVYTADAYRGVDVLRIDGGGHFAKKVKAPVPNEWFGSPTKDSTVFQPHPIYGFMCPVLKPDVDTPA
jgi:hypothetical protein